MNLYKQIPFGVIYAVSKSNTIWWKLPRDKDLDSHLVMTIFLLRLSLSENKHVHACDNEFKVVHTISIGTYIHINESLSNYSYNQQTRKYIRKIPLAYTHHYKLVYFTETIRNHFYEYFGWFPSIAYQIIIENLLCWVAFYSGQYTINEPTILCYHHQ